MPDQHAPVDPTTRYPRPQQPEQEIEWPGLTGDMSPEPDHGEDTYRGADRLTDRVAVITGADSGIGRAVAIAFAREGADVVLSYLPSEEDDAKQVVEHVEQAGRRAVAVPGDLSSEEACHELIDTAVDELGRVDVLVGNHSQQIHVADIADLSSEQFDRTMRTNVHAMFWLSKRAIPHIQPGGSIIITSSIQAYDPSPGLLDYATTKAAEKAFAKGLSQQLAPKGIRVNVVAPGPIWTPLQPSGGQPPSKIPDFGSQTPLGRAGQPAELAPAYVFLASGESSYVVGATIHVNGGQPTA